MRVKGQEDKAPRVIWDVMCRWVLEYRRTGRWKRAKNEKLRLSIEVLQPLHFRLGVKSTKSGNREQQRGTLPRVSSAQSF